MLSKIALKNFLKDVFRGIFSSLNRSSSSIKVFSKMLQIHRKTPVLECIFNIYEKPGVDAFSESFKLPTQTSGSRLT